MSVVEVLWAMKEMIWMVIDINILVNLPQCVTTYNVHPEMSAFLSPFLISEN